MRDIASRFPVTLGFSRGCVRRLANSHSHSEEPARREMDVTGIEPVPAGWTKLALASVVQARNARTPRVRSQ